MPVNPLNIRYPNRDDQLVTLAFRGLGHESVAGHHPSGPGRGIVAMFANMEVVDLFMQMAHLSLVLCFFNLLLPIPPLDGSRVVRVLIGMSHEQYYKLAQYGYIPVILVWQIPAVQQFVMGTTDSVFYLVAYWSGFR